MCLGDWALSLGRTENVRLSISGDCWITERAFCIQPAWSVLVDTALIQVYSQRE